MPRQSLADLLGNVEPNKPEDPVRVASAEKSKPTRGGRSREEEGAVGQRVDPSPSASATTFASAGDGLPIYLRMVRKETRLREDQQNQLTIHARRLNRAKTAGTARITDNSLIRIAVDLLLDRIDAAAGDDEAAILRSLTAPPS